MMHVLVATSDSIFSAGLRQIQQQLVQKRAAQSASPGIESFPHTTHKRRSIHSNDMQWLSKLVQPLL